MVMLTRTAGAAKSPKWDWMDSFGARERDLYCQPTGPNPPYHLDNFSRPALRLGSLNSLFHVTE